MHQYATYESSGGWWNCNTDGQNDIWGCGKSGQGFQISNENAPCSVLTKAIGNNDVGDCSNPDIGCWENLGADGGITELFSTRKFAGTYQTYASTAPFCTNTLGALSDMVCIFKNQAEEV